MEITLLDLRVVGIAYKHILELSITQHINDHAHATLILEIGDENSVTEKLCDRQVQIFAALPSGRENIFMGVVEDSEKIYELDYTAICLKLVSMSYLLDKVKKSKTYQQTSMTHEDVMLDALGGRAKLCFNVTDRPIGSWSYRNNETDWEYVKRLASQCNASVFTDVTVETPVVYIGDSGRPINYELVQNSSRQLSYTTYTTQEIPRLGDHTPRGERVFSIVSNILRGVLISDYVVRRAEAFKRQTIYNQGSECRMLTGIVQEVKKNMVKVFFDSVDEEYNAGGDMWFEYATPYTCDDTTFGSGFFVMPEVNDKLRVFLPSADEGTAFAFGAISVPTHDNPNEAKWRSSGGQEILIGENGIRITSEEDSIYINMDCTEGIEVWSKKNILVESMKNITVSGDRGVTLMAENEVNLSTDSSSLIIQNEKIVMGAANLRIN